MFETIDKKALELYFEYLDWRDKKRRNKRRKCCKYRRSRHGMK